MMTTNYIFHVWCSLIPPSKRIGSSFSLTQYSQWTETVCHFINIRFGNRFICLSPPTRAALQIRLMLTCYRSQRHSYAWNTWHIGWDYGRGHRLIYTYVCEFFRVVSLLVHLVTSEQILEIRWAHEVSRTPFSYFEDEINLCFKIYERKFECE